MQPDITFFSRFVADIVAGRKTITLRDSSEAHFQPGQILRVGRYEDGELFCSIKVLSVTPIHFSALNEQHALQENMSLDELKQVINQIYPGLEQLYEIAFSLQQ